MPTTIGARKASCVLVVLLLSPSIALGQSAIAGRGEGHIRSCPPGRNDRSGKPGAYRKSPFGCLG